MKKLSKLLLGTGMSLMAMNSTAATFIGDRTDFRDETIYFAMTARFYDGDKSNNTYCWDGILNVEDPEWRGDFKGLIEKMDYLKALGFTAIWITPVVENASGLDYHGYHAFNFDKVDRRNESDDAKFQDVIDEAHKRGMKIVLDIVLQHTGNFGENYLCPMFKKANIKNQSNHERTMRRHPESKLPENYSSLIPDAQYQTRLNLLKNKDGSGGDPNNYWHHVGQAWDWDDPSRWWAQIEGDCVDLNTENPHVYNYLVDCYSKFINMGVDGFRIDTSGHISRLTFNKVFIPRFHEAAEKAKAKRGGTPFYMFGEVCAVAEEVIYRNQHFNCSPCFYTWKETKDYAWDENEESWNGLVYSEANPSEYANTVNGASVLAQGKDYLNHDSSIMPNSDNAFLKGNEYHTPDYSQSSRFNVIDFPMHQRYYRASNAFSVRHDDNLYNDATWNVVYVDSHDYGPNGYKVNAFDGSEETWAENLSLMFTWRGIPCVFQGTETRFRRTGGYVIDKGPKEALKKTLRAYYGGYLTGSVNTTDFAEYTDATGNLAASLTHPLALHLQRLNKIRAAVPALRKGQYSTEGCSGEMSFKRRYKDSKTDSYVLVTISGSSTFTGILNGRYVDAVTGDVKNVTDGKLTATCSGKGNMRVYVLNGPGKIGDESKYLYTSAPTETEQLPYDGHQEDGDKETIREDGPYNPTSVVFTPGEGAFKTDTQTITAKLTDDAISGWYKIGDDARVTLSAGVSRSFTIGEDMAYGDRVTVTWGATGEDGEENTGSATYRKVDPNAVISVYVTSNSVPNVYAWKTGSSTALNGAWPGSKPTQTTTIDGKEFHYIDFAGEENISVIFSNGGSQTPDITGITETTYFEYDGGSGYKKLDINVPPTPQKPTVKANPASGTVFAETLEITLTATPAVPIYYTLDGSTPSESSTRYNGPIHIGETTTIKTFAENEIGASVNSFTYTKGEVPTPSEGYTVYFDNANSNWSAVYAYVYGDGNNDLIGTWPGKAMETDAATGYYKLHIDTDKDLTASNIIFNNNSGSQTGDGVTIKHNGIYNMSGFTGNYVTITGIDSVSAAIDNVKVVARGGVLYVASPCDGFITIVRADGTMTTRTVYEGLNVIDDLQRGFYIVNRTKVIL